MDYVFPFRINNKYHYSRLALDFRCILTLFVFGKQINKHCYCYYCFISLYCQHFQIFSRFTFSFFQRRFHFLFGLRTHTYETRKTKNKNKIYNKLAQAHCFTHTHTYILSYVCIRMYMQ